MKFLNTLIIIFPLIISNVVHAQIPIGDPTWVLRKNDGFDSLKLSNWETAYPWSAGGSPVSNGLEYNDPSNLLFTSSSGQTYLSIKCEKLTTPIVYTSGPNSPYYYKSGVIWSKFQYKYGYFEISAKLPAGYQGYWPAFWLWGSGPNSYCPDGYLNEIDIVENGGETSKFTDRMGSNYHWKDYVLCRDSALNGFIAEPSIIQGDIKTEHKYGLLWEPRKMTFYFDNIPMKVFIDPIYTPEHAINTIINFAIDPWWFPLPTTVFPAYFDVNYLNIWQLQPDANCSKVENICNFNSGTYTYLVKKSVVIGGSGCTSNINTSSNVSFWATDFIQINEGTTITDNGSGGFSANITNCPN